MAMIDYGSVVFKNGKRYKEYDLFPIIDELNVYFYKYCIIDYATDEGFMWFFGSKKSYIFERDGYKYHIQYVCLGVYVCHITGKNDYYTVIFGYGIDNNKFEWDRIKVKYLGKKNSKKVDNILNRYTDWKAYKIN